MKSFFVPILFLIILLLSPLANGQVEINLESSSTYVSPGENFTISVHVNPDVPVTGIQATVKFDPSFAEATLVEEGELLQASGDPTSFEMGSIDNESGIVPNIRGFILGKSNISSDGYFAHISFTAGNSSGTYEFETQNIVVSNENGESLPVVSQSVFVSSPSSSTSSATSSSAGGGSGGGGSDGEPPSNLALKEIDTENLVSKTPVSYGFNDPQNPVISINFTPLTNAGRTKATVELLNDTSVFVDFPAGEYVYANFNLWVGLAGYATPSNIEDAEIVFRIPMEWFEEMGVTVSDIELKRYNEGVWTSLPTELLFEKQDYAYFRSQTPGFSPFAVTYNKPDYSSPADISTEGVSGIETSSDAAQNDILPELSQNGAFLLMITLLLLAFYRH